MNKVRITYTTIKNKISSLYEKGAFHVVAGSFLTKFVSFFGSIFLVRILSKSDYGILGYYENLFGYFAIAQGFGMTNGIQRYMVLESDMQGKQGCYTYAIKRGTLYNAIIVVCCIGFALLYPHPQVFLPYKTIMVVMALIIPFLFFQQAGLSAFRSLFDYKRYALLSFCVTVALIIGRVIGAYVGGLTGTVLGRLGVEVGGGLLCAILVKRIYFKRMSYSVPKAETRREFNRYSWQMMLTDGLWAIFMLNDLFLLGQFSGNEAIIADYKVAYVIPSNLAILVSAIGIFVTPYFVKYEKEKNYTWIRKNFKIVLLVSIIIVGSAALICSLLSKPIIKLLYGESYISAVPIMRVLLVAAFFNIGIRATIANALSAMGQQKYNLCIAGAAIIVQIALNCICIPKFGAYSVAWTSVLVHVGMSMFLLFIFWKKYYSSSAKQLNN